MKKWIICLFAISLICGCSTTPSAPEPHETKYAIQVIEITSPSLIQMDLVHEQGWVEEVIKKPNTKVFEYPILYAGIGEKVISDQMTKMSFLVGVKDATGKLVPKEKEYKSGRSAEFTINSVTNDSIIYTALVQNLSLYGCKKIKLEDGIEIDEPIFNEKTVAAEISPSFGVWQTIGGGTSSSESVFVSVRLIAPQEK